MYIGLLWHFVIIEEPWIKNNNNNLVANLTTLLGKFSKIPYGNQQISDLLCLWYNNKHFLLYCLLNIKTWKGKHHNLNCDPKRDCTTYLLKSESGNGTLSVMPWISVCETDWLDSTVHITTVYPWCCRVTCT